MHLLCTYSFNQVSGMPTYQGPAYIFSSPSVFVQGKNYCCHLQEKTRATQLGSGGLWL